MPYLKGKHSVLIRKHFEDRESWLNGRQELGIGGSDAAAVCGLSPWTSPVELWKIKTGQKQQRDISGNAAVEHGVRMEPALRELYAAMNPQMKVDHYPYDILAQIERPWLTATLDGELTDENGRHGAHRADKAGREGAWLLRRARGLQRHPSGGAGCGGGLHRGHPAECR